MTQYIFHRQDGHSSDYSEGLEFPDREAARKEAAGICADMMRGINGLARNGAAIYRRP